MQKVTRSRTGVSAAMAMLLLALSPAGFTQAAADGGARREAAELKIEELKQRLALTPEQQAQLAPIVEARNARLRELRESHGADTSRRARMAMLKEGRRIQEDFNAQVAPILTKEQNQEWEEIRSEIRAAAKERMRSRR